MVAETYRGVERVVAGRGLKNSLNLTQSLNVMSEDKVTSSGGGLNLTNTTSLL